jgi:hypothetical protein
MKYIAFALLVLIASSYAANVNIDADGPLLNVQLAKYDPFPAEAGKVVTLWIKTENIGSGKAKDSTFTIDPKYPLRAISDTEINYGSLESGEDIILEYRLAVDENAPSGITKIDFYYAPDNKGRFIKKFNITIEKAKNVSDLKALFVEALPEPAAGRKSILTMDVANTASGTALFTILKVSTPAGEIKRDRIYVGNLEPDDFDSVDVEIDVTAEEGTYPVFIEFEYKDKDDITHITNDTVMLRLISAKEAAAQDTPPVNIFEYVLYIIIIGVVIKYLVLPRIRKKKR